MVGRGDSRECGGSEGMGLVKESDVWVRARKGNKNVTKEKKKKREKKGLVPRICLDRATVDRSVKSLFLRR